ncbi:tetratricopeptide repeat protein 16 [Trypanosoma grayi]|uniref:tetratricopeptide repeat protein 16 n=1 Tax=Trypanosoma grayi TaxID=71804 RepID=UPI0004F415C1|nr:tetratricopeptide repeat protein 16 [Trypanosoma grayi]KEG09196.1 tetratricopeptide repeat protein 16 [Trypanosoma grayi]
MDQRRGIASSPAKGELKYQHGLIFMQHARFREAINAFAEASFFMPRKPQPLIAAAECYVSLCDFQGAVKQYRRSLWLLRPRDEKDGEDPLDIAALVQPPASFERRPGSCSTKGLDDNKGEDDATPQVSGPPSVAHGTPPPSAFRARLAAASGDDCALVESVQTRLAGILDALSITLFNAKDYLQALRFADDSLELRRHPQVVLHRCAYLVALEREDEAEKELEKHLKENPDFMIESSSLLVHLYCIRQAFQHAKALLEKVPVPDRQHPQILLSQHIFDSAYSVFRQRSIEHSDLQALTRCLLVFPEDAALLFERAKHHINNKKDKKAVPDLFRCIKVSDGQHKAAIELMTKTLFRVGASLDGENGIRDAIEYYTTSLIWHAENIPVLLARGDCYRRIGDYQHALQDFMRVENIAPRHPAATRRIAFLHDIWGSKFHTQGKLADAEREFSNAIATCDTEPLFYYHRACCRFDLNEPRYALRDVLSCQRLNAQDPTIQDFVKSHLCNITQRPEVQQPADVKLPEVPSRVLRHAATLYGKAQAKAAKRLQNNQQQMHLKCDSKVLGQAVFGAGETSMLTGAELTCRRAKLSLPSEFTNDTRGATPRLRVLRGTMQ